MKDPGGAIRPGLLSYLAIMETLTLKLNGTTTLDLPGKGTSGYSWSVVAIPVGIVRITQEYLIPVEPMPGASGIERFTVTGIARGTCTLQFRLQRSWEKDKEPLDTKSYTVSVGQ
jgi:predicted secreted protein